MGNVLKKIFQAIANLIEPGLLDGPVRFYEDRKLGDNCIVFENFTASIGDLMVVN